MRLRTTGLLPAPTVVLRWGLVSLIALLAACGPGRSASEGVTRFEMPSTEVPTAEAPSAQRFELPPLPPLVFVRQGNIWLNDGTDSEPKQLTDLGLFTYADQPAVSPADGRIAFVAVSSPSTATIEANRQAPSSLTYALTVMEADGSNQQVIWEYIQGPLMLPSWSADGTALFVTTAEILATPDVNGRSQRLRGMRVPLSGGIPQPVIEDAISLSMAPDGSALAYLQVSATEPVFLVVLAAPDGSDPQDILEAVDFQNMYALRFSADGEPLVFVAMGGPPTDEQGKPIATRQPSPLERVLGFLEPPVAEAHGDPWGVWTLNRDGTGLRLVLSLFHGLPTASFSPDGSQLAAIDSRGIYLVQADGSQAQQIGFEGDSGGLVWVP